MKKPNDFAMSKYYFFFILFLGTQTINAQQTGIQVVNTDAKHYLSDHLIFTLDDLEDAITLRDLNRRFPTTWVDQYISVSISSICDGEERFANSKNDTLTEEQLTLLRNTNSSCDIEVLVEYLPENELKFNPPRQIDYKLYKSDMYEAEFPGGMDSLITYMRTRVLSQLSDEQIDTVVMTTIRFSIAEGGQIADARAIYNSGSKAVDQILMDAICNLPEWSPAKDKSGGYVVQEFDFSIGKALLAGCKKYETP